jgi:hypothetical protein
LLADQIRPRLQMIEAMLLLILARLLILFVPMRWWRKTLGRVDENTSGSPPNPVARQMALAVIRATRWLPFEFVCLPRAMAVQWMCRRRQVSSALVIMIAPRAERGQPHAFHAWVEVGDQVVIGKDEVRNYHRGLVLVQP